MTKSLPGGKGVRVRPESVRRARLEAGLTLEQVAGGRVTRTAIHLIEAGRNRPTPGTLEQIARATGKPVSFFKDDDGRPGERSASRQRHLGGLEDLKRAVAAGRVAEILSQAEDFLEHEPDLFEQGAARLMIAEALLINGDAPGAASWAHKARGDCRGSSPSPGAARSLLIEGRARQLGRESSAELLFRSALRECQALRPVPRLLEAEIACDLILNLGEAFQWAAARAVYEELRPFRMLPAPLSAPLIHDEIVSHMSRASDLTRADHLAERAIALNELAQCQAQVATMAAELGLHQLKRSGARGQPPG